MSLSETAARLVDLAPDAILAFDAAGVVRLANRAAGALLCRAQADLVGTSIASLFAAPDLEGQLRAAAPDGPEVELAFTPESGAPRWLGFRARAAASATMVYVADRTQRRRGEASWGKLYGAARAAIVTTDGQQRITALNPAACAQFGVRETDLVGQPLSVLLPERLREAHAAHHRALGPGDELKPRRLVTGLHADGREMPLEVTVFRAAVGAHTTYTAIVRDVREREAMLARVREAKGHYASVFHSVPVGLVLLRARDFVVEEVNDAYVAISGIRRERIVGANYATFVSDPEATRRIAAKFQRQGSITDEPYVYRRPDGSVAHALISSRAFVRRGEPCLLFFVADVTARLAAEAGLRDDARRFEDLAESIRECFWIADTRSGAALYASPAFAEVWGVSPEDLVRGGLDRWVASIHPEDRERVAHEMRARLASGEYDVEYRIVRPDGSTRWVHSRIWPLPGGPTGSERIVGVAEDITERHELELQYAQAQKMESLGQLAGGVAHDFNNWLTVITGNLELLEGEPLSPPMIELLHEVRTAADRASLLTRQLLAFSRRDVAQTTVVDVNEVVRGTMKMLGPLLGEDVAVSTRTSSKIGRVIADTSQLAQVLMNLAVNARDAMPSGGELTLATSRVAIGPDAAPAGVMPGDYVVLAVSDTGVGVAPDVAPRIFEPFFTTKPLGRGTGLGLAVVHGIVAEAGGFVTVESELGHGATFRIHLPERIPPAGVALAGAESVARPGECVLVAEEEESVRRIAVRALAQAGFAVVAAATGDEALARLASAGRIDLVFAAVAPSSQDAIVAAAAARVPAARVLCTSGTAAEGDARVAGVTTAFLAKPYTRSSLLRKVREVLDA